MRVSSIWQYTGPTQNRSLFQFMDGKAVPASCISKQLHIIIEILFGLNTNYHKGHSFRISS